MKFCVLLLKAVIPVLLPSTVDSQTQTRTSSSVSEYSASSSSFASSGSAAAAAAGAAAGVAAAAAAPGWIRGAVVIGRCVERCSAPALLTLNNTIFWEFLLEVVEDEGFWILRLLDEHCFHDLDADKNIGL